MKIFKSKESLKKEISKVRNISFIPTMGGLHKGHISLIKRSKKFKGKTLVSIFVNPAQFEDKKDFKDYPRNIKKDLNILKELRINYVFLPIKKEILNFRTSKKVYLSSFSKKLCGKTRKSHFKGVLNIVNRFLEIIRPKYIFLGLKDFQQFCLIKKHIIKRKINTKVIACPTIREKNGIACYTRNNNLTLKQKKIASRVYNYLKNKKKLLNIPFLDVRKKLYNLGVDKIDYLEFLNLKSLRYPKNRNEKFNVFIAYFLKKTRLIDNF